MKRASASEHRRSERLRTPRELGLRMPAEWAPHRATWITWPESGDWPGKLASVEWAYADIVRELGRGEGVGVLVRSAASEARARAILTRAAVPLAPIDFHRIATDRSWTRDYLPLFVVGGRATPQRGSRGRRSGLGAVKWRFNGWARYPNHKRDDAAGHWLAEARAARAWQPTVVLHGRPTRVVLEGGSIDVDGRGTLLTTDECLLTSRRARHRGLGRAGFERLFHDYLGIDRVIWLERGIAGDDTSGHIDDFARFVAPGRVVVCEESNRRDPNHAPLRAAQRSLTRASDARGRRLDVVGLPMPRPVVYRGSRLPASYANFYIANRAVLVPTFNDPNDRVALTILAELFPDRDVVPIHCTDLVVGLGTIHCSTQQEPAS